MRKQNIHPLTDLAAWVGWFALLGLVLLLFSDKFEASEYPDRFIPLPQWFIPLVVIGGGSVWLMGKLEHVERFCRKHWRACVVAIGLVAMARLTVPCPLHGNWVGSLTMHLCEDHAFLRFSDGGAAFFHGDLKPQHKGRYEKVGWNTSAWKSYPGDTTPPMVHVGWLFMRIEFSADRHGEGATYWFRRDRHLITAGQMVKKAKQNASTPAPALITKVENCLLHLTENQHAGSETGAPPK